MRGLLTTGLALTLSVIIGAACHGQEAAAPQRRPAVLFVGSGQASCGFDVATRLDKSGFALGALHKELDQQALAWDDVRSYNVLVVYDLGRCNADMTLPQWTQETIATLKRFLEAGGGVLQVARFGQMATEAPAPQAFLKPLGLTPLFAEMPTDPGTEVVATSWRLPFAFTDDIPPSPVSAGVSGLWYPTPHLRVGGQNHTIPCQADESWQVVARGSRSSLTHRGPLQAASPTDPGTYATQIPLVALKQVGKGRIVYVGITPEYLFGANAMTTLEGILLERGLRQVPSQGYKLVENSLRWLAEPSLATAELGGAPTEAAMLQDPRKTRFGEPYAWTPTVTFPAVEPACPGVIGARTRYSTGRATVQEWVDAGKKAGLSFIVFLEDFASLSEGEFSQLKADCAAASSAAFSAIPGFTVDDEIGNHYFYFGTAFPYPPKHFLSADGKVFISRDLEIDPKSGLVKGQLAMTTLDYAYTLSSFKLTAGNYLFGKSAAPFANWFSNWDAVAVITQQDGALREDATAGFLKLVDFGNGPLPLVVDLMDDPQVLARSKWRTVLCMPGGGEQTIAGLLRPETKIGDYFNTWNFYPDNPAKIYVTSGPRIESWSYVGQRDYAGDNPGDFVWQNQRWLLRGRVTSEVGLKEVRVVDHGQVIRRYLPGGAKECEFQLDLVHDRQHNLVVIATDVGGGRAISGEQWDRNHRLEEFMCADRNNQLSYGYSTRQDGTGLLLGGNQTLATPNKRLAPGISPSGTFKNDALLGAPAFDGAAGGEPEVWETVLAKVNGKEVASPNVSESARVFHSGDVHIGEGVRQFDFADSVGVYNVWHTLWRTTPARDFTVTRRNHFFQVDPDSPLAVFLWQIDIRLLRDLPNEGFLLAQMGPHEARLWAARGTDGQALAGQWEDTQQSPRRELRLPVGRGGYLAMLDSPLGGAAIFPLTEGVTASLSLPGKDSARLDLDQAMAPQKAGEAKRVELLLVGIPRMTPGTGGLAAPTTETVERFQRDFGLADGKPSYTVNANSGRVTGQRYLLDLDGTEGQCFSGQLKGTLVSSLPLRVSGLHDNWSAVLYDRGRKQARPIGVVENRAWATVVLPGTLDLFVGHPVVADNPQVRLQVTQSGEKSWHVEVHNPTEAALTVKVWANPLFDPLAAKTIPPETMTVPGGGSVWREW
jgi:hypothetical protein